ncbi:hypothetical protein [Nocardiopsis synnemataformans]|uniref:hypothetical protein n=1 Tax=Nocardiopsis synnemataformans TaxID=61305 RepID=UPI003EB8BC14
MSRQVHTTTALTKAVRDGRTATVEVVHTQQALPHGRRDDSVQLVARLDGEQVGTSTALSHPRNLPDGFVASIGVLALTQAEADQVEAVLSQVKAGVPEDLWETRAHLVERLSAARDIAADAVGRAHDAGALDPYLSPRGDRDRHERDIADAQRALAEFDARHPQVVADLRAQRADDVQRWMQQ